MKRLRIISSVNPRHGGPIEGIRQQIPHHLAAGIEEHVVTLDAPDAPWVRDFPIPLHACGEPGGTTPAWKRLLPWRRYGYQPGFVPWLRAHIHEYDLVIVHGLWNFSTMGARLALVGAGVPYVVFAHGMLDPWFKQAAPWKSRAKQLFWWFNEGPLVNNARYILFTSEEEKLLSRHSFTPYTPNERVIIYGTSAPPADDGTQDAAFRQTVPALARPFLLYLSRLHPKKGCDLLLTAFAEIAATHADLDLVMAGPATDEYLAQLKQQAAALGISGRVHWPGMLQGAAKWGAYRAAEAFVLPSHQENFGIVVAEGMACGKPVLITNKINIWREVEACGAGLVEPDDQPGISRLLRRFLDLTPEERAATGARAARGFREKFEITQVAASINAACEDAVRQPVR